MHKAQERVGKEKMTKRSPPAESGDAIKVSAKDSQSYAGILKEMKASVNPEDSGLEVLSIRRERKEEVLLVLKKGGDISEFQKALNRVVRVRAKIEALGFTDVSHLLQLGKVRVRWVNCRIREHAEDVRCFRSPKYDHVSWGCTRPSRKDACWRCGDLTHRAKECKTLPKCLTCTDRAKGILPMFLGSALARCSGKNSGDWWTGSKVPARRIL